MANTTRGIPYPDEYNNPADVPAALESLAVVVDTLVGAVDNKANNATTSAAAANTAAAAAANTASTHTHNGTNSPNVAIAAVSGLGGALAGKSDTGHTHPQYSLTDHSHTSAELAAHTHNDYAATSHTHTQAQSHNSPDTDGSPTAIHHTLGFGANQAAAGNHLHSGYAPTDHNHSGFAPTTHTHNDFSLTTHAHATLYAAISHTHDAANITAGTLAIGRIPTGTTSSTVALGNHSHATLDVTTMNVSSTFTASTSSGSAAFRVGSDGKVYSNGVANNTTTSAANVRSGASAQLLLSTSTMRVKDEIAPLHGDLAGVPDHKLADFGASVDPYDVLDVSPAEFRSLCTADNAQRSLGFIAEDVAEKFPWAAEWDDMDAPVSVQDRPILAALLTVVKDQQARIESLEQALQNR